MSADQERKRGLKQPETLPDQQTAKQKPDLVHLDQNKQLSPELAHRLQTQIGNLAVSELLQRPGNQGVEGNQIEANKDEEEVEEKKENVEEDARSKSRGDHARMPGAAKGLPAATGAGFAQELQYGGDDDDPFNLPDDLKRELFFFLRPGRGNQARLDSLRGAGRLPASTLSATERLFRASSPISGAQKSPLSGDMRFRSPVLAWEDQSLLAGRSLSPEELGDHAGPLDPLFRPVLAARWIASRASGRLTRALCDLETRAMGLLMSESVGACGAATRLGTLCVLALAAEERHLRDQSGALLDLSVQLALTGDCVERVLSVAGDIRSSVSPAHVLFRKVTSSVARRSDRPAPCEPQPWIGPALRLASQMNPIAELPSFDPPPPPEPQTLSPLCEYLDRALQTGSGHHGSTLAQVEVQPLIAASNQILASTGRFQVELCACSLTARRPEDDPILLAILQDAFLSCRAEALRALELRQRSESLVSLPRSLGSAQGAELFLELKAARLRLEETRTHAIAGFAALFSQEARARPPTMAEPDVDPEASALLEESCNYLGEARIEAASRVLDRCLASARLRQDTLAELAACTIRTAIAVHQRDHDLGMTLSGRQGYLAVARRNMPALADAAISRSALLLERSMERDAIRAVVKGAMHVLSHRDTLSVVPLRARMAELRELVGPERFQELIESIRRGAPQENPATPLD